MRVRDHWVFEEPPPIDDESSDLLTIPELKHCLTSHRDEDEEDDLGLRSLLEHPEALARSFRQQLHAA